MSIGREQDETLHLKLLAPLRELFKDEVKSRRKVVRIWGQAYTL